LAHCIMMRAGHDITFGTLCCDVSCVPLAVVDDAPRV
jgi:hypothetical protein